MKQYEFNARFSDVDFRRILNENPDADFIKVQWTPRGKDRQSIVLVSNRGANRMSAAGIPKPQTYPSIGLSHNGEHWGHGVTGTPVYVIKDIEYYKKMIISLSTHEAESHRILVTPTR
jgi:hypothetical protein